MQIAARTVPLPEDDPLSELSAEEIQACVRLLAISLAEHRARFGVVPIADGGTAANARGARALPTDAATTLREAVGALISGREKPAPAQQAESSFDDKRRQMRISLTAPVQISAPDGSALRAATLRNISWGGAALRSPQLGAAAGEKICLHLPAGRGEKIAIVATILRVSPVGTEQECALRFDSLAPEDEERLQKVLEVLVAAPQQDGRRTDVRLVQRLEIEYGDAGELRATLEDISASGLMLMVPEPLEPDQSLLVSLSCADTAFGLSLRARVMHQAPVEAGGLTMYRVGLQFEHPTRQLQARVSAVLRQLATLAPSEIAVSAHESEAAALVVAQG
ncbi:MAG: PilZ domain-containing protein [Gammaproteobacteria bacterium]